MARHIRFRRFELLYAALIAVVVLMAAVAPLNAQTTGATTLGDIMDRQNRLKLGLDLEPPPVIPTTPDAVLTAPLATRGGQSDPDIWRALKAGERGKPSSDTATGQLIQKLGEDWRLLRGEIIVRYSGYVLGSVIVLIALFRLLRGKIKIRAGRSGRTISRFSLSHRVAHWFLAATFIVMAISGLIILLGRPLLLPLIGREVNALLAGAALQVHNLLGLVFVLALLIVIVRFMKGNFLQRADLGWIRKVGGLIGGHASSNRYNFGEKAWYWMVVLFGLGMSVTGPFLLFPWLSDILALHQGATILHATGAVVLIAMAMGHIYIGSIGMEGSLDSMLSGQVDENWAREHHDLWYQQVTGKSAEDGDDSAAAGKT